MTDVDEHLLTAAKLGEGSRGDLDADTSLLPHAALVDDPGHRQVLTFVESALRREGSSLQDEPLGADLSEWYTTEAATRSVSEGNGSLMSNVVGVTEQNMDGSALTVTLELVKRLHFDGAPSFVSVAGNPNTGKTNSANKLVEVADRAGNLIEAVPDDFLVVSNQASWDRTDVVATSMHDLMLTLLTHREKNIIIVIDEASTHFDARTKSYEVASQWTPAAKRFAKIGVWSCFLITHTGKDLHPEAKRLTTLAAWKETKKDVVFYDDWPADDDTPDDPVWQDPVSGFEKADGYDPDDAAPWNWNLRADLFEKDLGWSDLLDELQARGPAED